MLQLIAYINISIYIQNHNWHFHFIFGITFVVKIEILVIWWCYKYSIIDKLGSTIYCIVCCPKVICMSGTEKIGQTQFCANNDEHIHKNGMNVKLWIWKNVGAKGHIWEIRLSWYQLNKLPLIKKSMLRTMARCINFSIFCIRCTKCIN